jgi:hypothetical protein
MAVLTPFLQTVLETGRLLLRAPLPAQPEPETAPLLADAYRLHALGVAGPPIPFDPATAQAASRVLYHAAWYFLNPIDRVESTALQMPAGPTTASQHLSGDLLLRYLPAVYRRARALRPADELVGRLADLLRRWPLSGVLANVEDGPLTPTDFGGHRGLQLLYAERLTAHDKPEWQPTGPTLEAVELVELMKNPSPTAGRGTLSNDDYGTL